MFDLKKHFGNELFDGSTVQFLPKYKPTMEGVTKAAGLYETLINEKKDTPYPVGSSHSVTVGTGDNAHTETRYHDPTGEQKEEWAVKRAGWKKNNNILIGYFQLTMTASTFDHFKNMTASEAWTLMNKMYGQPTLSTIYGDFLKAVTFTLNQQNPLGTVSNAHLGYDHHLGHLGLTAQFSSLFCRPCFGIILGLCVHMLSEHKEMGSPIH
ncbi:hypothetical protein PM082_022743 [Marasmius tenuissimus]|nr:hypothetical protein PM082_022743 [Marasmius tenuissimus]